MHVMSVPLINRASLSITSPHDDCNSIVKYESKKWVDGVQEAHATDKHQQTSTVVKQGKHLVKPTPKIFVKFPLSSRGCKVRYKR
jgi:transaldolase